MESDKRTLALVLGASEFPHSPTLGGGEAFENSAQDFRRYLYDARGLNLPPADVLDLFDNDRPASELLQSILDFLKKKQSRKTSTQIKSLLVYYVGHGGFTMGGHEYFLAVQSTRSGAEGFTSIRISDLGHIIKESARFLCQYLILDCCFSAQAYATFQSGPGEAAVTKTLDSVPTKGTALLCSSGPREVSLAPEGCEHTMFSEALLKVLKTGDPKLGEYLSLYQVRDLIDWHLRDSYEDARVRPQIQCPSQPEGDVSHTPLFPNPAYALPSPEWRRVIVADDPTPQTHSGGAEASALREMVSALRNPLPSVRIAALKELTELAKLTHSARIVGSARAEILERSETDDSTQVRNCATEALAECPIAETRVYPTVTIENDPEKPILQELLEERPSVGATSDLEGLNLFLEATWKLNNSGVLDEVLYTLLDAALKLTNAERGFVFLVQGDGELRLAAGLHKNGDHLNDDSTISRSILSDAAKSASEFLVTDTDETAKLGRENVVSPRTVICIPLRKTVIQEKVKDDVRPGEHNDSQGVLYLDAHSLPGELSSVSRDILRTIAKAAATLVENATLLQAEDAAKRYRQELAIAAEIQQRLMTVTVPDVPYAKINAVSYACKDIGGDFFDLIYTDKGLSLIVADVSGKGVSAAVVASVLQGMLYSQLAQDRALPELIAGVNRFMCDKVGGQKYATLIVARLEPSGRLEIINCGAVPPLLVSNGSVVKFEEGNLPIGLVSVAEFSSVHHQMKPGDRVVFVTDGVTEAEDATGEYFGTERLESCVRSGFVATEQAVTEFRGDTPLTDDFTMTEMIYRG